MIFRSPFPQVRIPEVSLTEFVFERAGEFADKPALIEGTTARTITYGRLRELVGRAAAGLARRGFSKGDVLAVYSPNVPEFAVAFHGAATLGGVVTTVNPLYTEDELECQLRDAGARWLVTAPALLEKAAAAARAAGVGEIFVFGEADGATPFASLLEADPADAPRVEINAREDLVALPYSSGTTGVSKGVMLTHRNCVANLAQIEGSDHANTRDTLVCVLPLFHIYGLQVILNYGLRIGATIVTLPRFDLELLLGVIEKYRVTMAHFVPPIMLALAKSPAVSDFDLSSLKTIFSAAAPLGPDVVRAVADRLGCHVKQGYGMTEAAPATHMMPAEPERNRVGSVGVPVSNMECKLVSVETGEELGAGEAGEVCVRGPQVMRGYLNRADATAQSIDADGWLHTGDIGYADEDGYLFIVDRAKELIKYKGFQVAPAELEALLLTHPSVADAAVIPSPDEEAGEVPKAVVVVKDGHGLTEQEVLEFVAGRVAPHKKVRLVEFAAQIPKSPSGKILRRLLVQRERERAGA
ncbi:MAG TPA: 4-coumarate--CoA ligase family protein [Pyrinomonadaceae bacterium]|nr:4-coumarate--CoA ligase family protein [Pyrinomonadaceae bacterium]